MTTTVDDRESPRVVGLRQWRSIHRKLDGYKSEIAAAITGNGDDFIDATVDVFVGEENFSRLVTSWGPNRVGSLAKIGARMGNLRGQNNNVGRFWPVMGPSRSVRVDIKWGPKATSAQKAQVRDIAWGAYMAVCSYVEDPADLVRHRG